MKWQPIETAPKDGTFILVSERWDNVPYLVSWVYGGWMPRTENLATNGDATIVSDMASEHITHWLPLPEAYCDTCNGHGSVGGLTLQGYDCEDCPDCN